MAEIKKIAIVGASGNFGTPITAALRKAAFELTIISRAQSKTQHPEGIRVLRPEYTVEQLTKAFEGQDAVVCVVGPGGIPYQSTFIDAAEAAGVKRFLIDDFGWGPQPRSFPEFDAIHAQRKAGWDRAKAKADANSNFTWTGVTTGNPIDWAMKKFPLMGFDVAQNKAIIYDSGEECFTGTTLEGIGQSVLGVMQHPAKTTNSFVKVMSLKTCQNDLLKAFEESTGETWEVQHNTVAELQKTGRAKHQSGRGGWILDLVVSQLFDPGEARGRVADSWDATDCDLLGVREESPREVVDKIVKAVK